MLQYIAEEPGLAERIAPVITDWVHDECVESMSDRNKFLDNLEDMRASLALPLDDHGNVQIKKTHSHHDRQRLWGDALEEDPQSDFWTAHNIFNFLMAVSGTAKKLCYFTATDQEDYLKKKTSPDVVGIDVVDAVRVAFAFQRHRDGDNKPTGNGLLVPTATEIRDQALAQYEQEAANLEYLRRRTETDFGVEGSDAAITLHRRQIRWVGLVTNGVLSAMGYRDGALESVPALEPKSISDMTDPPTIIYPFREAA